MVVILLYSLTIQVTNAQKPVDPPGTYYTSWIGNTFMDVVGRKVVTESITDVCVSPDGIVFTAGYAEAWGGGASYKASDGSFAGRYAGSNSGFGDPLSVTAATDNYVYFGYNGALLRAAHGGTNGGYTRYLSGKNIQGLYIKNGKLYVSDFGDGKIRILNISTMVEESNFSCTYPTRLTVDNSGNIWVVIYSTASVQPPSGGPMWIGEKIKSFSSAGVPGAEITDFEKPLSVAINNSGQLLVGGLNENSQIWIYDITTTPTKVGTFGEDKGIFGGATAGAFSNTAKLHWIRSISVDASDNIYTACTYGTFWGGVIEKWNTAGELQWRNFAGTSLDCAGIDPDNETEVYSKFHHYSLDYSKRTPGTEWSLKGFTVDRFKYPNDNRVDQNTDVQVRSLGAGAYRIGGKLFVARSRQYGYPWELYRQDFTTDGEVLVPSVMMGNGGDHFNHFYNSTTKTWYDKPVKDDLYNQYWCIAKNGDIFTIADNPDYIIQYQYQGLDENNNPIWDAEHATKTPSPMDYDARRVYYDSDEDVMYIAGDEPEGEWDTFLKIRRYDNWSGGNRTPAFTSTLVYNDPQYTPETSYGAGTPNSFTVAGDYMFVLYGYGHIRVLSKTDGTLVGTLVQDVANGWHGSGGQVDAPYSLTAYKRMNGEYIFFFENAAWANIMMQRWCPDGTCSEILTAVDSISLSPDTLNVYGTGTGKLTANFFPDSASNKSISWISSNPGVATVKGGPNGTCTVTGITLGSCTITGTTKDGNKTDSSIVIVNNLEVTGIMLTPDSVVVGISRTKQLTGNVFPSTATNKNVIWESSDTSIAKVNSTGLVTGISLGSAQIRCISEDGYKADSCSVTVAVTGDGLEAEYFNTIDLTGEIALSRTDATVDFSYGDSSYVSGQPADHFSVRWLGQVQPLYSETYTFETACDDGSRLWVNGKQLVNNWVVQSQTPKKGTINLIAGIKYNIKMEYFENDGGASAHLSWSSPSQAYEIIPQDQLWTSYTHIPVTGIKITPSSATIKIGATTSLNPVFLPDNASIQDAVWSSDNVSVASVDSRGKVTGKTAGQAIITVTTVDGDFTSTAKVIVENIAVPKTPPLISLSFNEGTGLIPVNTGTLSATFKLSTGIPTWSDNVPATGGAYSIDFGDVANTHVVESDAVINGLKSLDAFTITGWVNCRSSEEGGGGNRIVSWINDGGDGVDLVYHSDGSLQMGVNQWSDAGSPPRSTPGKITTDPDAGVSNWVFFAVSYDGAGQTSYYFGSNTGDAMPDNSVDYAMGAVGTGISKLAIGHFNVATRSNATDRMFRGLIDEINIFGEALTEDRIVQVQNDTYTSVVNSTLSDLVLYPNPLIGNNLTISGLKTGDVEIAFTDLSGRTVYNTKLKTSGKISVSGLSIRPGMYLITLKQEDRVECKKLFVK
jgi:uncharacterized protein YjdB